MSELENFLKELELLKIEVPEPNFFSAGGPGDKENPLSKLLALFMGSRQGAPRWLAKALLTCLSDNGHFDAQKLAGIHWESIETECEVVCPDGGRIDLVVSDGNFVLGIEHKVNALIDNPFAQYNECLESYDCVTRVKCVLRPSHNKHEIPAEHKDWHNISYDQLINKALSLFGQDVAESSHTKWQVFYQELLLHLRSIENRKEEKTMDNKELPIVLNNYPQLIKSANLLKEFKAHLNNKGEQCLRESLATDEIKSTALHSLTNKAVDDYKVLRFYPEKWNNQAHVMLVFSESGLAKEGFYVQACIKESERWNLKQIRHKFEKITAKNWPWYPRDNESVAWSEDNNLLLILSAWPKEATLESAMVALSTLAKWVQENVFEETSHPALEPS
ncbi:PD-(D/E)XK nuclease superfamily protein [Modicisalibacter muralis]|uniref:PD-(D/E)XK nuclease superfamily protein n=1 Tax=Modicisalibacter muralis TaxID=119000 RepID=A0A1G9F5I4_9GAMM|nr:PD-(D/E)XK nuclease family protein [Halomonas muralis]SDK83590.1 PD-(D/E)XK nuclease superfamily protein [Halomonas muralis]